MKNLFYNWKRRGQANYLIGFLSILLMPFINSMVMMEGEDEGGGNVEKTIKKALAEEITALKDSLKVFTKTEDMQKELSKITKQIEDQNVKGLNDSVAELTKAVEQQGLLLKKMQDEGAGSQKKTILDVVKEKAADLAALASKQLSPVNFTVSKDVLTANVTVDKPYYSEPGVREIQRGVPWIRNLFNTVNLGSNTHSMVDWWEQLAVTNNAAVGAEGTGPKTQSNLTWIRRILNDKIIHDFVKVSKDRLKDVDFIAGELNTLLTRNMRLLENRELLIGDGTGNHIDGVTSIAKTFTTAGIEIKNANLIDLVGKIKTQILKNSLGGFMPNYFVTEPGEIDNIRYAKDEFGRYLFERWATGENVNFGGMQLIETVLPQEVDGSATWGNKVLVMDTTLGTIYVWDDILIEAGYVDKDFTNGMVTLSARMRENLRIKTNDQEGFVYVDDITTALAAINLSLA